MSESYNDVISVHHENLSDIAGDKNSSNNRVNLNKYGLNVENIADSDFYLKLKKNKKSNKIRLFFSSPKGNSPKNIHTKPKRPITKSLERISQNPEHASYYRNCSVKPGDIFGDKLVIAGIEQLDGIEPKHADVSIEVAKMYLQQKSPNFDHMRDLNEFIKPEVATSIWANPHQFPDAIELEKGMFAEPDEHDQVAPPLNRIRNTNFVKQFEIAKKPTFFGNTIHKASLQLADAVTKVFRYIRKRPRRQENWNIMLECMSNDIANLYGISAQQQFLKRNLYQSGSDQYTSKIPMEKNFIPLKKYFNPQLKQSVLLENPNHIQPGQKTLKVKDLGFSFGIMAVLGDPDGLGSRFQNKGVVREGDQLRLFGIDFGQALRKPSRIIKNLKENLQFGKNTEKNYDVFNDTAFDERMLGMMRVYMMAGDRIRNAIFSEAEQEHILTCIDSYLAQPHLKGYQHLFKNEQNEFKLDDSFLWPLEDYRSKLLVDQDRAEKKLLHISRKYLMLKDKDPQEYFDRMKEDVLELRLKLEKQKEHLRIEAVKNNPSEKARLEKECDKLMNKLHKKAARLNKLEPGIKENKKFTSMIQQALEAKRNRRIDEVVLLKNEIDLLTKDQQIDSVSKHKQLKPLYQRLHSLEKKLAESNSIDSKKLVQSYQLNKYRKKLLKKMCVEDQRVKDCQHYLKQHEKTVGILQQNLMGLLTKMKNNFKYSYQERMLLDGLEKLCAETESSFKYGDQQVNYSQLHYKDRNHSAAWQLRVEGERVYVVHSQIAKNKDVLNVVDEYFTQNSLFDYEIKMENGRVCLSFAKSDLGEVCGLLLEEKIASYKKGCDVENRSGAVLVCRR